MSRRAYRSTRRRRYGRYDPSPVLLVTEDDRGHLIAAVFRLLRRHRSGLAPFTTALCLLVAGGWAHATHPGGAPVLLALTAACTAVLAVPPGRWPGRAGRQLVARLDRWPVYAHRAERHYAAAVVALAGLWLSAATRWGATVAPLPSVLLLGTLAAGVPWWTHRRRRMRVRISRILDAWPTFSDSIGLPGSRLVSALGDRWGWSGRLALRRGQTVAQTIAAAGAIESALAVRPGAVRIEPDPVRADRAVLRVIETDPLAAAVPWPGLPGAGTTEHGRAPSILDPVELGLFEDGTPVLLHAAYRNALIGGMIGSGKSGVLNVLLAFLVACRDVAVWGIDLKGGMELRPWEPCLGRLATTGDDAVALLRDAIAERNRRMHTLAGRLWDPAKHGPALIVLVDEFAELPEEGKRLAESLARIGRAVMVNLVVATQRPTQEALGGGALRSQCEIRVCLRMKEKRDVDLVLDRGAWAAGWRGDLLDLPGKLLLSDPEHTIPRPARDYQILDPDIDRTAISHAGYQPVITAPDHGLTIPEDMKHTGDTEDNGDSGTIHNNPSGVHSPPLTTGQDDNDEDRASAAAVLWELLTHAPDHGITVPHMMTATGLSRPWVYLRLREHNDAGRLAAVSRGHYRAITTPPDTPHSDPWDPDTRDPDSAT